MAGQRADKPEIEPTLHAEQDTRSRILQAAEELLRAHGREKMTVVDVARHLGMSHANVYKHFESKAELRSAVVEVWLNRIARSLEPFVTGDAQAGERLRGWVRKLVEMKRNKVLGDPEMFRAYQALAESAPGAVTRHIAHMIAQLTAILQDGSASGEWDVPEPKAAAAAILNATSRFHHPHFLMENAGTDEELGRVMDLLMAGLRSKSI